MAEIISELLEVAVDTDATVEIASTLPETLINVTKSITAEIQPENYVLTSGGMYTGNMTGAVPTWLLNAIQQQLTTGDGNVMSVLDDMQSLLSSLQLGVNQAISQIENTNVSMSALATSLSSQIGVNSADILDVYATRVTATEAQAIAAQAIGTTFGGNVDAYIGNLASVYTSAGSATATNIATLQASYNDQTARIDTVEEVAIAAAVVIRSATAPTLTTHPTLKSGDYWVDISNSNAEYVWNGTSWDETTTGSAEQAYTWSAKASKLITSPDGSVTGWSFGDGSNTQSEFKIQAENFSVSDGITGYTPFSIVDSNIQFNGTVSFTNVTNAPVIPNSTSDLTNDSGYTTLTAVANQGYVLPAGVADAINTNTTTIDGGKITTGSITSGQIAANSITAGMLTAGAVTVDTLDFSTVALRNAWAESIGTVLLENTTMVQQFFQAANDGATLSVYKTAVPTFRYRNGYSGYINMWRTATTIEFLFYDNEYGTITKSLPVIQQIYNGTEKVSITIDLRGYEGAANLDPAVLTFTYANFAAIPTTATRMWTHTYSGGGALEIDVICSLTSTYIISGVDIINYLNTGLGGMSTKIGRVFNVGASNSAGDIDVVLPYGVYTIYKPKYSYDILIAHKIAGWYNNLTSDCYEGVAFVPGSHQVSQPIYNHNTITPLHVAYYYGTTSSAGNWDMQCTSSSLSLTNYTGTVYLLKVG